MKDPVTHFDPRFSDPDAQPTPWNQVEEVLQSAQISWITTVRRNGRPHVTPLVAIWQGYAVYFTTGPDEQKALNLSHHPHVVVTTGCAVWDGGIDVVVEGEATRVLEASALERLAAAWASKWDGRWRFEVTPEGFYHEDGGTAHVYEVRPKKVLAFARGTFGQTRYLAG